ncbi:kinetochore Sim4 complex subunit FTA2-domain-containing protein [Xylariaceae sp. FL1019]|nr:kinetochore Sim4 complex subunit FTA2-domain-containing protein [Xylariaceae sp. FL1019]
MARLPDVPGPKLAPFDTNGEPLEIEFVKEIGKGSHSLVWEVTINGSNYALKIFNWNTGTPDDQGVELTDDEWENYFWPFPNECRAYGRLKEFHQEHLAFKCYGYLKIEGSHFEFLREVYNDFAGRHWYYVPELEECQEKSLHAIVKELVTIPDGVHRLDLSMNRRMARRAIKNLDSLHKLGICDLDINEDNFMMGKQLDFSTAMTAPHPFLTRKHGDSFKPLREAELDRGALDELIRDWNERHPNEQQIAFRCRMSPYNLRQNKPDYIRPKRFHPADFDYEKARSQHDKTNERKVKCKTETTRDNGNKSKPKNSKEAPIQSEP